MLALLVVAWSAFGWSAMRRWSLLRAGQPASRFDRIGERLLGTWRWAFKQERMDYYQPSGIAHKLIFLGFAVLLAAHARALGARVFAAFNLFVLAPWMPLGPRLRVREGLRRAARPRRRRGLLLLPPRQAAEAHDAQPRGAAHPRHHRHDDDRRHDVRRRVARAARAQGRALRRWARARSRRPRNATRFARSSRRSASRSSRASRRRSSGRRFRRPRARSSRSSSGPRSRRARVARARSASGRTRRSSSSS